MPGVSAEQNVFSGPVCNESTFETQNVHSPRRSFYEEQQPEFHSHCLQQVPLTNMDQVHNFNFFSDSTNSEKCTPRITKDASVTAHKLFGKSLSLGAKICFPDDFSSVDSNGHFSEAFLSNPASFLEVKDNNPMLNARNGPVFESQDSITALHKFLPSNNEDEASWPGVDAYSCDEFRMYEFKVRRCTRGRSHDWTECPFAHPGEKARRRDPRRFHYSGTGCPDFRKGSCRRGDACEFAHGVFECWLHPARYRTQPCKDGRNCRRRVCFFAHTPEQLRLLPGASQTTNLGSRNLLQRNSVSGSYDGSPLRYAVSAAASFDGAFGYEGGTNCMLFDGNSSNSNSSAASPRGGNPCGHLGYLCKPNTSQTSSPTSTLVGHSHSPPPLSPPLSPSGSPPLSPDSPNWLNSVSYASPSGYQKAAVKNVVPASYASLAAGYHNSSNVAATLGLNSPVAGHRRQVEKMGSIPTLTIPNMDTRGISSPVSPAADCFSVNQSTKLMGDVINSLQHLELGSAPMWLQQQQHQSSQLGVAHGSPRAASNLRHSSVSLPCTPNKTRWETRFENWEAVENDDGLQRVESGRDLRAKIYGRLSKESIVQDGNTESPDLGWVNELVM